MTVTKFPCKNLDDLLYAEVYKDWIASTNQYEIMVDSTVKVIKSEFGNRENGIKVLSIGAGTGEFDAQVLSACKDVNIEKICFFEPNVDFLQLLRAKFEKMDIPCAVVPEEFDVSSTPDDQYDLVLFAHSLYCVKPNAASVFATAEKWLSPNGKAFAILQAECAFPRIFRAARKEDLILPSGVFDHALSTENLVQDVKATGLDVGHNILEATVDVDCLLSSKHLGDDAMKTKGLNIICFILGVDVRDAPDEMIEKWRGLVKQESTQNKDTGKWTMPTLDGFIWFTKKSSAITATDPDGGPALMFDEVTPTKTVVEHFNDDQYTKWFAQVRARSTEYNFMKDWTVKFLKERIGGEGNAPLKLLSVGGGVGNFEFDILKALGYANTVADGEKPLLSITTFEPNPIHAKAFHEKLDEMAEVVVLPRNFSTEEVQPMEFDVVLYSHSLYYFKDPAAAFAHTVSWLAPKGCVLGITCGQGVFNKICREAHRDHFTFNTPGSALPHTLNAVGLHHVLESAGLASGSATEDHSGFLFNAEIDQVEEEGILDIVSFSIMTDVCSPVVNPELRTKWLEEVKAAMVVQCDNNGHGPRMNLLPHPTGFVWYDKE